MANNNMKKSNSNQSLILDINEYIRFDKVEKGIKDKEELISINNVNNIRKSFFNKKNKKCTPQLALPYNVNNWDKNMITSIKIDNTVLPISHTNTPVNSPNKEYTSETLFSFF